MDMQSSDAQGPEAPERGERISTWDATRYDDEHAYVWKYGASLLELLAPLPGERILDVGCGTGHLTAQIAAAGAHMVGIDKSVSMVAEAQRNYPQLQFEVADARTFRFTEPFDAVFSNAALHWIKEPERAITCVRVALKPGGRFVAEFGGNGNVQKIVAALTDAARAITGATLEPPWYFPSIAEYATLLEQASLEVTFATLFDRPTPLEGEGAMRRWVEMFAADLLSQFAPENRNAFLSHVEDRLHPALFQNGTWFADYRRLRVVARRIAMGRTTHELPMA
jgi:trans-aconitate 2-methyltransferase